jgi:hypothetical protein
MSKNEPTNKQINLTMWVLHRHGEVWQDEEGHMIFQTRVQAKNYWSCCVPEKNIGWRVKKVRVTG